MTNEVLAKRIAELERQLSDERMKNLRIAAERDALAAQNALLNAHLKRMQVFVAEYIIPNSCVGDSEFTEQMIYLLDGPEQRKAQATPAQCLAEIRAEAVEKFSSVLASRVEAPDASATKIEYYKAAIRHVLQFASGYAAKLRQGSE